MSVGGQKRVEAIPASAMAEVEAIVTRGRAYLDAVAEVRAINAELLRLWKKAQRPKARRRKKAQ